nr:MAG TPA: hypothetical protein [Caudoviricetes sp.]
MQNKIIDREDNKSSLSMFLIHKMKLCDNILFLCNNKIMILLL